MLVIMINDGDDENNDGHKINHYYHHYDCSECIHLTMANKVICNEYLHSLQNVYLADKVHICDSRTFQKNENT